MMNTALLFAAGRGERLRPLTDAHPKALCTVQGSSLIEHHVRNLASAGFEHLVINHAHLGGLIRATLGNGARFGVHITYSPEPPGALETGGGLVNALPYLGEEPFITLNTDIFTDYPFAALRETAQNGPAHLVLCKKPIYKAEGDFGINEKGMLTNHRYYTFTGIACFRPTLFQAKKIGRYSLTPFLRQLANDAIATAELYEGTWHDIGTLECLRQLTEQ